MTARFYDDLSPHYPLLYRDWDSAVEQQGAALAALLQSEGVVPGDPVLDAACGIGTQTLGLASRGYRMSRAGLGMGRRPVRPADVPHVGISRRGLQDARDP